DYLDSVEQEGRAPLHELVALQVPRRAQLGRGPSRLDPGAEGGAPGEQVDGRQVLDELVLVGPPAEAGRVLRARVHDACGAEADRLQRPRVGDVDLYALAAGSAVLVPGGRECARAEPHARPVLRRERR